MFEEKRNVPGSGSYVIKSAAFPERSRFHMGNKLNEVTKLNTPGSGAYNPEHSFVKKAS